MNVVYDDFIKFVGERKFISELKHIKNVLMNVFNIPSIDKRIQFVDSEINRRTVTHCIE